MHLPTFIEGEESYYEYESNTVCFEANPPTLTILHELAHWLHYQLDPDVYLATHRDPHEWVNDFHEQVAVYVAIKAAAQWLTQESFVYELSRSPVTFRLAMQHISPQTREYAESLLHNFLGIPEVRELFIQCLPQ